MPNACSASSRCSIGVSSSFAWLMPFVDEEKIITVGTPVRATSAASCRGPDGQPAVGAGDLADRRAGDVDQALVERDRLDPPDLLDLHRAALLGGEPLGGREELGLHRRQRGGVEVALVDQYLGAARHGRDDARRAGGGADRADAVVAQRDLAQLERGSRGREKRVAPLADGRRAGVRGLAGEVRPEALDADGAEHRADGEALGLEHRALLDVQLQVGAGAVQAVAGREHAADLDAVGAQYVFEALSVAIAQVGELAGTR